MSVAQKSLGIQGAVNCNIPTLKIRRKGQLGNPDSVVKRVVGWIKMATFGYPPGRERGEGILPMEELIGMCLVVVISIRAAIGGHTDEI